MRKSPIVMGTLAGGAFAASAYAVPSNAFEPISPEYEQRNAQIGLIQEAHAAATAKATMLKSTLLSETPDDSCASTFIREDEAIMQANPKETWTPTSVRALTGCEDASDGLIITALDLSAQEREVNSLFDDLRAEIIATEQIRPRTTPELYIQTGKFALLGVLASGVAFLVYGLANKIPENAFKRKS